MSRSLTVSLKQHCFGIRETRERKVRIRIEKPRSVVFRLVVAALLSTPVVADAADISRGAFYPTSYVPSQGTEAQQPALSTGSLEVIDAMVVQR